jgi:plastocyanin
MQKIISLKAAGFCLLILTLLALLAACGGTNSTNPPTTTPTAASTPTSTPTAASTPTSSTSTQTPTATPASGNAPSVSIVNFSFSPASLTVSVGTKVTWTNNDSTTHTVTDDHGAFNQMLSPGQTFTFTFTKAGTYTYHCNIHRSMTATIIVH